MLSSGEATRDHSRDGRCGLPHRVAPRPRHPDPAARRLRPRGGGAARRLHRGGRAVAAGRRAGQPAGLAGLRRPLQGDRRHPAPRPLRRLADRGGRAAARGGRRAAASWTTRTLGDDRLRLIFTCCHPALAARCAGGPHPARGLRAHHRGDRPRLPHGDADDGPAHRPREGQDPHRAHPVPRARSGRAAGAARGRAAGDLSRLQRGILRLLGRRAHPARPVRRGDPAGPAAGGAPARSPRRWACSRSCCCTSRGAPRAASADGEIVLLGDQDRSRWDRALIAEGAELVRRRRWPRGRFGPYTVQAAIAAVHAEAPTAEATDWGQIVGLYDVLLEADPSPVIELNRAVAVAMRDGPAAGLALIDAILARGDLDGYHLAHSARADLSRRLGRVEEARSRLPARAGADPAGAGAAVPGAEAGGAAGLARQASCVPGSTPHTRATKDYHHAIQDPTPSRWHGRTVPVRAASRQRDR